MSEETKQDKTEKRGPKKPRIEIMVGIVAAIVIIVVAALFGTHTVCIHSWESATCTEPETCKICGATQGKKLGHKWDDATCVLPETCVRCNKTKGEPLGHKWGDATCTEPKTCSVCGETQGEPLGHDVKEWTVTKEATCSEAGTQEGTCARCGKTQTQSIAKLDHTPGDWEVTQDVSISSTGYVTPGTQEQKCTVCGMVLDSKEYTVEVSTAQVNALRSAASYLNMGGFSYKGLVEQLEFEGFSNDDATFAVDHSGADWMVQAELSAESYMKYMSFSRSGLIDQLEFEGFTSEQAAHGADHVGL